MTEFEAFAENAERLTGKAMEKLAALQEPYIAAYEAWLAARREWNVLARYNELEPVPHSPLPRPGEIFTAQPPRPPQIEHPDGPGPVSEEPAQPDAGTPRTYEHEDGRTQGVQVGDPLDSVFAEDPNWRVVEVDAADG